MASDKDSSLPSQDGDRGPEKARTRDETSEITDDSTTDREREQFERLGDRGSPNFFVEFWWFLRENKRWWMAPIVIALLLLMGLAILTGTGAAPFIYSLF